MERTPSLEERLLGRTIADKYHLVEVQASGAFGTVFRAEQYFCKQFMRPVAVKVSRQSGLTEDDAPYLFGDAIILAQLLAGSDHDGKRHLVQIHDMGFLPDHDQRAYLVMEYVDGLPLVSHLRAAGRVSVAAGLRYIKEMCTGLALVHAQGAIHRDLHHSNILLDRRGVVRVVDFGLASFADPRLGFVPGSIGNFMYMAPETVLGRSTPASDVYALGLLMYELFTGGGPHLTAPWSNDERSDHRDEHYRMKEALGFAPPSELHNEVRNDHRWLDALILRCLALDPAKRFADAGQLLSAIETCEAGGELPPITAVEPSEGTASPAIAQKHPDEQRGSDVGGFEKLLHEVRRLLASRAYDQVIDRLDVHRPAEWAVIDAAGARALRTLGQAYLGRGDLATARDCLEQLRSAQGEQALLSRQDYAAALSDLVKCYRGLGQPALAETRREEARQLLHG